MKVAVIIPTYKGYFLGAQLHSILGSQFAGEIEIHVVLDGPESVAWIPPTIASQIHVWSSLTNVGPYLCKNSVYEKVLKSKPDFVWFLDSDDQVHHNTLQTLVNEIGDDPIRFPQTIECDSEMIPFDPIVRKRAVGCPLFRPGLWKGYLPWRTAADTATVLLYEGLFHKRFESHEAKITRRNWTVQLTHDKRTGSGYLERQFKQQVARTRFNAEYHKLNPITIPLKKGPIFAEQIVDADDWMVLYMSHKHAVQPNIRDPIRLPREVMQHFRRDKTNHDLLSQPDVVNYWLQIKDRQDWIDAVRQIKQSGFVVLRSEIVEAGLRLTLWKQKRITRKVLP